VALIHNDIDMPLAKPDTEPVYLSQMKALLKRHPTTSIIWAHVGLGRIVHPVRVSAETAERHASHMEIVEAMLTDPALSHVSFDISWDEVAKYAVASPEAMARVVGMLNKYPDRFLFGTDTVAPAGPEPYYAVFQIWAPIWKQLTADASLKVRKGNYQRIFDLARQRVRAWERANLK
jgi:predicted TIM-barrel fold metal-dependent hydrolase